MGESSKGGCLATPGSSPAVFFLRAAEDPPNRIQYGLSRKHVFEACPLHWGQRLQVTILTPISSCHATRTLKRRSKKPFVYDDLIAEGMSLGYAVVECAGNQCSYKPSPEQYNPLYSANHGATAYSLLVRENGVGKRIARLYSESSLERRSGPPWRAGVYDGNTPGFPPETRLGLRQTIGSGIKFQQE